MPPPRGQTSGQTSRSQVETLEIPHATTAAQARPHTSTRKIPVGETFVGSAAAGGARQRKFGRRARGAGPQPDSPWPAAARAPLLPTRWCSRCSRGSVQRSPARDYNCATGATCAGEPQRAGLVGHSHSRRCRRAGGGGLGPSGGAAAGAGEYVIRLRAGGSFGCPAGAAPRPHRALWRAAGFNDPRRAPPGLQPGSSSPRPNEMHSAPLALPAAPATSALVCFCVRMCIV